MPDATWGNEDPPTRNKLKSASIRHVHFWLKIAGYSGLISSIILLLRYIAAIIQIFSGPINRDSVATIFYPVHYSQVLLFIPIVGITVAIMAICRQLIRGHYSLISLGRLLWMVHALLDVLYFISVAIFCYLFYNIEKDFLTFAIGILIKDSMIIFAFTFIPLYLFYQANRRYLFLKKSDRNADSKLDKAAKHLKLYKSWTSAKEIEAYEEDGWSGE